MSILNILNPLLNNTQQSGGKGGTGRAGKSARGSGARPAGPAEKPFSALLEQAENRAETPPPSEEALTRLLDDVHSAGDALSERPFLDELMRYKDAVRLFMSYIVENGFDLRTENGIPASRKSGFSWKRDAEKAMDHKTFSNVKVVDEKLEKLAAGVVTGQLKQLDLLAGIGEINGLLVNMLE